MGMLGALSKLFRPRPAKAGQGGAGRKSARPTSAYLEEEFSDCYDFEKRAVRLGGDGGEAVLMFLDGLVSGESVARDVLRPLTDPARFGGMSGAPAAEKMLEGSVYDYTARLRTSADEVVRDMLNGYCAVVFDGEKLAVTLETKSPDKRAIDQPKEEKIVKGSKDAFIEVMKTNTMLIRRKLRDKRLKIKELTIGDATHTGAAIVYLDGYTNPEITAEVEKRLRAIVTVGVLTSSEIEENIVDKPRTIFPQLLHTERPDKFCMNLLEGRVGVLVEGLPLGYLAPGTFAQFFKAPEDSASHFIVGSALTVLRYLAMIMSLLLPGFFVAVAMYHQEMIPTKLLQSMIAAKQSVPFPVAVEVVLMLIAFELLQEAGLRLPNPVGETVSIIGALIVGQSAVDAKIVSPVVVIVVALAGISGYTMPNQDMAAAMRVCRFLLVLAAILAGMFGVAVGCALLLYHLCTLESFGVPYMTPFVSADARELTRALLRRPASKSSPREPALSPGEETK